MEYAEIQAFPDLHFPVFGQNLGFCLNTGKYGYDSIHIRENTDQRKAVFPHISRSVLLDILNHNLDQREKAFSVRENYLCANIRIA